MIDRTCTSTGAATSMSMASPGASSVAIWLSSSDAGM
jgi:hypothetical protein